MSLGGLIVGGTVVAGAIKLLTPKTHDQLVESTYKELHRIIGDDYLYVDHHHYNPESSAGNTRALGLDTNDHYPDIVTHGSGQMYVVEVETNEEALNAEARSQLQDFSMSGYTRLLVVPHKYREAATEFAAEIDGKVDVTSPKKLSRENHIAVY